MLLKNRNPDDRIILRNDFHNTKCVIYPYENGKINKRQAQYAWHKLCGHYDCSCSNSLGIRGKQDVEITVYQDGTAKVIKKKIW